jgi:hypothetical protein
LLDYLLRVLPEKGIDPFKRLFNTIVNDYEEDPERFKEINVPMGRRDPEIYIKYKKSFGYATSSSGTTSRKALYGLALQNAGKRAADRVRDSQLIEQITGLETRNGRIDHAEGAHDDLVIGWLLCHWFLAFAVKHEFYGIDNKRIYSKVKTASEETWEQQAEREEQEELRARIEDLYEKLTNEDDEYVSARMELELRRLDKQLVLESGEVHSVDALIRQVKESKRSRQVARTRNYSHQQYSSPSVNGTPVVYNRPLNEYDLRAY